MPGSHMELIVVDASGVPQKQRLPYEVSDTISSRRSSARKDKMKKLRKKLHFKSSRRGKDPVEEQSEDRDDSERYSNDKNHYFEYPESRDRPEFYCSSDKSGDARDEPLGSQVETTQQDEGRKEDVGIFWRFFPSCFPLPYLVFCPPNNDEKPGETGVSGIIPASNTKPPAAAWSSPTGNSMMTDLSPEIRSKVYNAEKKSGDERLLSCQSSLESEQSTDESSDSSESRVGVRDFLNMLTNKSSETSEKSEKSEKGKLKDKPISINLGGEGSQDNITIDVNNVHFSGWDGKRSHYTISVSDSDARALATASTPKVSAENKIEDANNDDAGSISTTLEAARLQLLSPDCHPLKRHRSEALTSFSYDHGTSSSEYHTSNKFSRNQVSPRSKQLQPVIRFVPHTPKGASVGNDQRKDVEVTPNASGSDESAAGGACMPSNLFSVLLKGPHDEHHDRRVHVKRKTKDLALDELNGMHSPMSGEESRMILNFLGSSSSASTSDEEELRKEVATKSPSLASGKDKKYSTPISVLASGRPPLSQTRPQAPPEDSGKDVAKNTASDWNERGSLQSNVSNSNSAQTKTSHRRMNGVASATLFFSPNNTFTLEVKEKGKACLKAVPSSQNEILPQEDGKALKKSDRHHRNNDAPRERTGLQHGWRQAASVTPDLANTVVTCDSREEEMMSPLMADDYSPAVKYEKSIKEKNSDGEKRFDKTAPECTPIQRSSLKLRKKQKNWGDSNNRQRNMVTGKKKMKFPFLRNHESVNRNLFGDGKEEFGVDTRKEEAGASGLAMDGQTDEGRNISLSVSEKSMSLFLPKCAKQIQCQNLTEDSRNGTCVLEGWMAFQYGGDSSRLKRIDRKNFKYIVLFENLPTLYIFNAPGDSYAYEEVDLAGGHVAAVPVMVSKQLGQGIDIQRKNTNEVVCTLLPIRLDAAFFEDDACTNLVPQDQLERLFKSSLSTRSSKVPRKAQWGEPEYMTQIAPIGQHSACLHLLYAIDIVMSRFFRLSATASSTRESGPPVIKIMVQ